MGIILTASVVHDVSARREAWTLLECGPEDTECLALLCPAGMVYNVTAGECWVQPGYTCCAACSQVYRCYPPHHQPHCCVRPLSEGVVPSAYTRICR